MPSDDSFVFGYNKNDKINYIIVFEYSIRDDAMISKKPITITHEGFLSTVSKLWPGIMHLKISL
jgi:hypothetical protein